MKGIICFTIVSYFSFKMVGEVNKSAGKVNSLFLLLSDTLL